MLAKPEYSSPPIRFVAGRGAVAKLLQAGDRRHRGLPAGTLQRRAIGKMLLAGSAMAELLAGSAIAKRMAALWQRAIGKMLPAGAPWRSCWQGAPQWQRCCRTVRRGRAAGKGRRSGRDAAGRGAAEDRGKRARQQAPARQAICRKGCTIGKTLQAGALQRRAIGKQARKEPCCKQGKSTPCWANKKESGKTHSLLSPL